MGIQKGTWFDWARTVFIAFSVLWIRMAVHYLGQYILLKLIDAPVTDVTIKWYKIKMTYSYWTMW